MIPHHGLTARKHMLTNVGHEKTRGKPEPYQQVEHRAEQPRERCEQVGSGSGPEPKRRQHWHLVPRPCLACALSHDHGVASPCSSATERPVVYAGECHPGLLVYCIFYTVKIRLGAAIPLPKRVSPPVTEVGSSGLTKLLISRENELDLVGSPRGGPSEPAPFASSERIARPCSRQELRQQDSAPRRNRNSRQAQGGPRPRPRPNGRSGCSRYC